MNYIGREISAEKDFVEILLQRTYSHTRHAYDKLQRTYMYTNI